MPFGKYKGKPIKEIWQIDPQYIKWLQENCDDWTVIEMINLFLNINENNKIELIIKEALMSRGYSESEALMFIKRLKHE